LDEGHKVRLVITYRGREMAHQEFGRDLLNRCLAALEEKAIVEQSAKMEGSNLGVLLGAKAPGPKAKAAKAEAVTEEKPLKAKPEAAKAPKAEA
jgi:translation initiation factor IF-3